MFILFRAAHRKTNFLVNLYGDSKCSDSGSDSVCGSHAWAGAEMDILTESSNTTFSTHAHARVTISNRQLSSKYLCSRTSNQQLYSNSKPKSEGNLLLLFYLFQEGVKRKAKQFFYDLDTGAVVSIVDHGSGNATHVVSLVLSIHKVLQFKRAQNAVGQGGI